MARTKFKGVFRLVWFLYSGGWTAAVTGIGIVAHWSTPALISFGVAAFLFSMAWFVAKRERMLAEQGPKPGFHGEATGMAVPVGGWPIPRTVFLVNHDQTKEVPTPDGRVGAIRVLKPKDRKPVHREQLPKRLYLGFIPPIWLKSILVKGFTDAGIIVEGRRSTGMGVEVELYYEGTPEA